LRLSRSTSQPEITAHTVVCWDTLAETTSAHVKKGEPLYVEGRLECRTFEDGDGIERGVVEIGANDVQFLGRRPTDAVLSLCGVTTQTIGTPSTRWSDPQTILPRPGSPMPVLSAA
jgi:single-strand DNA-binding protein